MINNKPQMRAQQRCHILKEENGWTSENDVRKSGIKQINRALQTIRSNVPIKDGEKNARETPVNEEAPGSDASPRRIGGNMNKGSDELTNMYTVNGATTSAINIAGAQKHILLRRR